MKSWLSRFLASASLAAIGWLLLAGAAATSKPAAILEPHKLIILSTTDVKGKTGPCG